MWRIFPRTAELRAITPSNSSSSRSLMSKFHLVCSCRCTGVSLPRKLAKAFTPSSMINSHQAKYVAHVLSRQDPEGIGRISQSIFDAQVDLNPHQIEAALFALQSPRSKGVILAAEVGLGKTIEAGLILCQLWAEKKRRILIVCPASIRKQWALELQEKFHLPSTILDTPKYKQGLKTGNPRPFDSKEIIICSFSFAHRRQEEIRSIPFDLAVIDEAHKLRNCYRPSNKIGSSIRWALEERKKILLTATPLQNSLREIYGLSTFIDENIFGDRDAFSSQYMRSGGDLDHLRQRLKHFCKRTLRKDVSEYINYTERKALTHPFEPSDQEQAFYEDVDSSSAKISIACPIAVAIFSFSSCANSLPPPPKPFSERSNLSCAASTISGTAKIQTCKSSMTLN